MGILSRFKDIMNSNINALLDKVEDPEKMIDQYLRNLNRDLSELQSETAFVMASKMETERKLKKCESDIAKCMDYATSAVKSGKDDDARRFLNEKSVLEDKRNDLAIRFEADCENEAKMKEMFQKVSHDIEVLQSRRDSLKSRAVIAKSKERVNKMTGRAGINGDFSRFDNLEDKIINRLDHADAMLALNDVTERGTINSLKAKYDSGLKSAAVDEELAALKASMGMV